MGCHQFHPADLPRACTELDDRGAESEAQVQQLPDQQAAARNSFQLQRRARVCVVHPLLIINVCMCSCWHMCVCVLARILWTCCLARMLARIVARMLVRARVCVCVPAAACLFVKNSMHVFNKHSLLLEGMTSQPHTAVSLSPSRCLSARSFLGVSLGP